MLDRRRVKLMTEMALYEETLGKEDFKVSDYYRKDYVSMHILTSFLWVTVGYVCLGAIVALSCLDFLMEHMSMGVIVTLGAAAVIGYLVTVVVYGALASHIYGKKHKRARQRVKMYHHNLTRLLKMYEKEKK